MMKKLPVVLLFLATIIWSCNQSKSKKVKVVDSSLKQTSDTGQKAQQRTVNKASVVLPLIPPPTTPTRSLNNIDLSVVEKWTKEFVDKDFDKNVPPTQFSVWFSKTFFKAAYDLLKDEEAKTAPIIKGTPDGFRIYLLKDPSTGKPTIALISTKFNGVGSGRNKHVDYYDHKINHVLFNSSAENGLPSFDNCQEGARLYRDCEGSDCNTICPPPGSPDQHAVPQRYAQTMASYGNAPGTILKKHNTQSVWFSFKAIYDMANMPFNYDGIRIYLTNYSANDYQGNPNPSEKADRYTFLLTATKKNAAGVQADVFDCYHLKNLLTKMDDPDGGINNGELCPDHCNIDDLGVSPQMSKKSATPKK